MRQEIQFQPAFDKRNADPKKNFGIHGVTIRFLYGDEKGLTQFVLYTNWNLPHVTKELMNRPYEAIGGDPHWMERPMPADLGFHSPKPMFEGHTPRDCDLLPCGECYYDGSGFNADRIYKVLLEKGSDGVWEELKKYYEELFVK